LKNRAGSRNQGKLLFIVTFNLCSKVHSPFFKDGPSDLDLNNIILIGNTYYYTTELGPEIRGSYYSLLHLIFAQKYMPLSSKMGLPI